MLKTVLAGMLVFGSISVADAMPTAMVSPGASLPVVKADVVVKKVIHRRRPPVVHRTVVKKTIVTH